MGRCARSCAGDHWQLWLVQLWFLQFTHVAPPVPQAFFAVPSMHILPMQQPFGQDVASQTQLPLRQRLPVPQAAVVPH